MSTDHSYASHVVAHEQSVVLGGARVLHPVPASLTQAFARQIQAAVREAEALAYRRGVDDARGAMRAALGIAKR